MQKLLRRWDLIIVILLSLIYSIVLSYFSITRHNAFASGFDLGNMDQTVWNTLNGRFFALTSEAKTISRLSIHGDLILVLLSPFYLIWNNVRVLLILQSVALASGAIPVYLIAKKVLNNAYIAIGMAIIFLINPNMQWANTYDFHAVTLAIPLLLFSFYFALTKRWKLYLLTTTLCLLTKEQIPLTIAMMSVFVFFLTKERKMALLSFVMSVLWFVLMVFVVMPHFSPAGEHWALKWYKFSNDDGRNSIIPPLRVFIDKFILEESIYPYYESLLRPFAYLPLLGVPFLFIALPELAINIMSSYGQMKSVVFHYDSGITPWLIISAIYALKYIIFFLNKITFLKKYKMVGVYGITLIVLVFALRTNYHYSPLPSTPACWCYVYNVTDDERAFEKLLQQIPTNASVTASPEVRPHITHRENAYTLPTATSSADFIALIDQNRIVGDFNSKGFELELMQHLNKSPKHTLVKKIGHFSLYKKKSITFP